MDILDEERKIKALAEEEKIILSMRAKIPETCGGCVGCEGACCGIIPFSRWEWEQIEDKRQATSSDCPYLEKGRCSIYDKRPIICRLFGQPNARSPLKCRHGGCKVVGKPLTAAQIVKIGRRYTRLVDGAGEFFGPFAELFETIHKFRDQRRQHDDHKTPEVQSDRS